ncbi:MAG: hypothetical protein ACYCPT_02080 [Acidimicrobiales bacterium]
MKTYLIAVLAFVLATTGCATTGRAPGSVPSTPKLGSSMRWGGDLAGSTNVKQWVGSVTPTGGTSTIVPFNAGGLKLATSPWVLQDSGGVARDSFETAHGRITAGGGGTDAQTVVGPVPGSESATGGLFVIANGGTATATNALLTYNASVGSARLINPSAGSIAFQSNAIYYELLDGAGHAFFGSSDTTSPVTIGWSISTAPSIFSGTSATQLNIGTDLNGATLNLVAGQEVNAISITAATTGGSAVTTVTGGTKYATMSTQSSPAYAMTLTDHTIFADCTAQSMTITLPAPTAGWEGWVIDKLNNCGASSGKEIVLAPNGSQQIDNGTAGSSVTETNAGRRIRIFSDGTNYFTQSVGAVP